MPPSVTGTRSGPEPDGGATLSARTADPRPATWTWLALGLGITAALAIRVVLLPLPGLAGDVTDFLAWTRGIAQDGLGRAYDQPVSFPPVLPWIWAFLGAVAPAVLNPTSDDPLALTIIKLPATVADVAIAGLVGWVVAARAGSRWGAAAALAVLLHPAVIYVSAWWAQFESIYVLPMVVAWVLLARGRPTWAGVAIGVALMTKPQALPLAVPLAAFYLRRYGLLGSVAAVAASIVAAGLLWAPFVLHGGIQDYLGNLAHYANLFGVLSVDAWNPWFIVQEVLVPGRRITDTSALFGPVTFRVIGAVVAVVLLALVFVGVWRRPTMRGLAWGMAAASLAAFIGLTQMHERYSYPALVFLILAWPGRLAIGTWLLLSVAVPLNLFAAVPPGGKPGPIPVDGLVGIAGSIALTLGFALAMVGLRRAEPPSGDQPAEPAAEREQVPAQVVG